MTVAGLSVAAIAVVVGVAVVPTHVSFANGSIRCGTVLRPDRSSDLANACGPAGANQLRATLAMGLVLALLALVPLLIARLFRTQPWAVWATWAVLTLTVPVVGVAWLGIGVEYTPSSVFVDR